MNPTIRAKPAPPNKRRLCDCGRPGIYQRGSSFACERCAAIENNYAFNKYLHPDPRAYNSPRLRHQQGLPVYAMPQVNGLLSPSTS